tara:strand:+ start:96 stop:419 length:324 start_codon:yes stop_codon:yes gene_type:complete
MRNFNVYRINTNLEDLYELQGTLSFGDDKKVNVEMFSPNLQIIVLDSIKGKEFETVNDFFDIAQGFSTLLVFEVDKDGREFVVDVDENGNEQKVYKFVKEVEEETAE